MYMFRNFVLHKKLLLISVLHFLLVSTISFSTTFPETLSSRAKISIVEINYENFSRQCFSKYALRFYDKENHFDSIVDFSFFKDFDDSLFPLKFFIKNRKAFIKSFSFYEYFLNEKEKNLATISECLLNFSEEEIAYIYAFVSNLNNAMPDYSYDFDIKTNNSKTHIQSILQDAYFTDKISNERSFLISKKTLFSSSKSEFFPRIFLTNMHFLILFSATVFLALAFALYQTLVLFNKITYRSSVFYLVQTFDSLIFFFSGIIGIFFLYQFFFSNQCIFLYNFCFIVFNPLNVILSFLVFFQMQENKESEQQSSSSKFQKKLNFSFKTFWSISIVATILITVIRTIAIQKISINLILLEFFFLIRYSWYLILINKKPVPTFQPERVC